MTFQNQLINSLKANGPKVGIESATEFLTNSEILELSNKITASLLQNDLPNETVVGITLTDKTAIVIAMIGIANANCVFVPIDKKWPVERRNTVVEELNLKYLITDQAGLFSVEGQQMVELFYEDMMAQTQIEVLEYPQFQEASDIYIYFTSGSTGKPKGIVGRNESLLQFLNWEKNTFAKERPLRFSQFISPYFDAFLRDVFVPLLSGGTVCIPPSDEDFFTTDKMIQWIDAKKVNLIHCVPSLFRVFNADKLAPTLFADLEFVLMSGEKINPHELKNWYEIFDNRIKLFNLYGPTETTMIRSYYEIKPSDADKARIPIGQPIDATELLITKGDKDFKPCKTLIPGEVYIITKYATNGYLNNTPLNTEKFVEIPGLEEGEIAFKTGDRARKLMNGHIELLGREDRMIKLRGIRIELDEIETAITKSEMVKNAVVAVKSTAKGDEFLVAFVIVKNKALHLDPELELAHYLNTQMPDYMIPSKVMIVDDFPYLTSGKINYNKLMDRLDSHKMVEPANEIEAKLLLIWQEMLGDQPISTDASFHKIGGNSMGLMNLIAAIYQYFGIKVTLQDLFNNLTIQEQAELIKASTVTDLFKINIAREKPFYNISSSQMRMYYNNEINKESTAYNMPAIFKLKKDNDEGQIIAAINSLIARHESLRSSFEIRNNRPVQIIHEESAITPERIKCSESGLDEAVEQFIRPFDLSTESLFRYAFIESADGEKLLATDIHHIICDGVSQNIILLDFMKLYEGESLAPLSIQYKDYAEWEFGYRMTQEYLSNREFWLSSFEGSIPVLELPTNPKSTLDVDKGGEVSFEVDGNHLSDLLSAFKSNETTNFSLFYAIYFLYMSRITGQDDLVIGTVNAGRDQQEINEVVGMFTKTLPIRHQITLNQSFSDFVNEIHRYLVQANSHQAYDLSDILRDLNRSRQEPVTELFGAMFVYQNYDGEVIPSVSDVFELYDHTNTTAKYPITLMINDDGGVFNFQLQYSSSYFTKADVDNLIEQFKNLLQKIADTPDADIIDILGNGSIQENRHHEEMSFDF